MEKILDFESEVKAPLIELRGGMIPNEELAGLWPRISAALDRVPHIWNTHWTKEALYSGVMIGRFQLWGFGIKGFINVVVFTEIAEFPANRIFRVFMAFGNSLDLVLPIIEATLMRYAQASGCTLCEVMGRMGWERKLPNLKRVGVVLRCEVDRRRIH